MDTKSSAQFQAPREAPVVASYRGMDRAAIDRAYDNLAAVRDSAAFLASWEKRSAALRRSRPTALDLRYGDAERARIDLYLPRAEPRAWLVFFHGGYWIRNSKEAFAFVAEGPLAHDIAVACVGYTLAPAARLDQIVAEARAAVAWTVSRAGGGGQRPRVAVSGWSAGAHLAALAMDQPGVDLGLAISGLFDLEPIRLSSVNDTLRLDVEEAARNSPLIHLPAATSARPLVLSAGESELPEFRRQSWAYHVRRAAGGLPSEWLPIPNRHHFSILEELARPDGALCRRLQRWIDGYRL